MNRPLAYRERDLQTTVFDMLRLFGVPNLIAFHPANEGKRAARSPGFYKRLGILAGVADVVIVLPGGICKFLELKKPDGKTSLSQIAFATMCAANGCDYWVAKTPEEAAHVLFAWGALTQDPLAQRRAAA